MTFRTSLARYLRGVLDESTPTTSSPPTPNPTSSPPTTTPSMTTVPATSEAGLLATVLETMERMQRENLKEIRALVIDLTQGREIDAATLEKMQEQSLPPERMQFDPPDYDAPGTEDLPGGIQAIFEREQIEQEEVRQLRTQQEVLARQLDEARAALTDPQGPASAIFSSAD